MYFARVGQTSADAILAASRAEIAAEYPPPGVLARGEIRTWQGKLRQLGFLRPLSNGVYMTGYEGPRTRAATRAFEQRIGGAVAFLGNGTYKRSYDAIADEWIRTGRPAPPEGLPIVSSTAQGGGGGFLQIPSMSTTTAQVPQVELGDLVSIPRALTADVLPPEAPADALVIYRVVGLSRDPTRFTGRPYAWSSAQGTGLIPPRNKDVFESRGNIVRILRNDQVLYDASSTMSTTSQTTQSAQGGEGGGGGGGAPRLSLPLVLGGLALAGGLTWAALRSGRFGRG